MLLADLALLLVALYLGFQIEPTTEAAAASAKGQAIAIPAVGSAVLAVVLLVRPRGRRVVALAAVAVLLAAYAGYVLLTRDVPAPGTA